MSESLAMLPNPPILPYSAPYAYRRRPTRVVWVGNVAVGGDYPIRVQSMTTTRTQDLEATLAQVIRLVEVGCEIVRITAPTVADARAIGEVRYRLRQRGIQVPLVADIHFSPNAALEAAEHVEKVRINPGNYADSKSFAVREYSDAEYEAELGRIRNRFAPLVRKCRERGVAMRIGTNHGSLSDRIMNRFGDTPLGMVESALEFVRICRDLDYHDVIFSMKASNPKVMIQAYRLLAARLDALGWGYPLHLGVTEAGGGEDGRIKSAIGIGALLDDGLGDTIRVSLTEDPEAEVPVAFRLLAPYLDPAGQSLAERLPPRPHLPDGRDPYTFSRRLARELPRPGLGGSQPIGVALDWSPAQPDLTSAAPADLPPPDLVRLRGGDRLATELAAESTGLIVEVASAEGAREAPPETALLAPLHDEDPAIAAVAVERGLPLLLLASGADFESTVDTLFARSLRYEGTGVGQVLALELPDVSQTIRGYRLLASRLAERGQPWPLHLITPAPASDCADEDQEHELLSASVALGSLLSDGIGDSIEISGPAPAGQRLALSFGVLQGAGARITRTEYVACPSCGRTLFDLQETTARIQRRTGHLKGVKIAIMGCVVNGPGEMADADFGYVGGAPDQVNLYVGKTVVERNVPQAEADSRLIELIKRNGRWIDPDRQASCDD